MWVIMVKIVASRRRGGNDDDVDHQPKVWNWPERPRADVWNIVLSKVKVLCISADYRHWGHAIGLHISREDQAELKRCSTRDSWFQQLLLSCCSREIARSFIKDEIIWSMTDRRKWYYHELVSLACCSDVLLMQKFSDQRRPSFYSHYDQNLVWKWAFGVFYATHKLLGVQVDQHVKYSSVVALEFYKLLAISRILKRH